MGGTGGEQNWGGHDVKSQKSQNRSYKKILHEGIM